MLLAVISNRLNQIPALARSTNVASNWVSPNPTTAQSPGAQGPDRPPVIEGTAPQQSRLA